LCMTIQHSFLKNKSQLQFDIGLWKSTSQLPELEISSNQTVRIGGFYWEDRSIWRGFFSLCFKSKSHALCCSSSPTLLRSYKSLSSMTPSRRDRVDGCIAVHVSRCT
jgi:hypothetical protein